MRSHTDAGLVCAVALVALCATAPSARAAAAQQEPVAAKTESPGAVEIARAIDILKQDPNLAQRTMKMLRWKNAGAKPTRRPGWLSWISGFFDWVGQSARVLVWCAAIVLAAMLVVYILRVVQAHGVPHQEEPFVAPTHVRDLDIRPETLPADVGAAARGLWDRGEQRSALALLYRGLLSRLVHVYRVAIRDSSTEGDCLALASQLTETRREYAARLVGVWQRSVYGREDVAGDAVHALCDDFARVLDPSPRESIAAPGAA